MTSKEKAKELVEKIRLQMPPTIIPTASTRTNQLSCDIDLKGDTKNAIQCALIAVDEIINSVVITDLTTAENQFIYWEEVKSELEKL